MPLTADADIKALLEGARTIAMIGASDRPDRPSYGVMAKLQAHSQLEAVVVAIRTGLLPGPNGR